MFVVIFAAILAISCGSPAGKFMDDDGKKSIKEKPIILNDDDANYEDLIANKEKTSRKSKKSHKRMTIKQIKEMILANNSEIDLEEEILKIKEEEAREEEKEKIKNVKELRKYKKKKEEGG